MAFIPTSRVEILKACNETTYVLAIVVTELLLIEEPLSDSVKDILTQFSDVSPLELPKKLPSLQSLQQKIDFIPGSVLPNLPHYRMSPKEHEILQSIIEDLLKQQFIKPSLNPCVVEALIIPKKDEK